MEIPFAARSLIVVAAFAVLFALEQVAPFYGRLAARPRERIRHDVRNLALGLLNALCLGFGYAALLALAIEAARSQGIGLLPFLHLPPVASTVLAVLLLDLWMYAWHRLNHRMPFLWRFHRVHHGDAAMNASSAFRFHTGEVLFSSGLRLGVLPLLGVTLEQAALYEALFAALVLFHHADVRLPERVDRVVRALFVTPAVHRVHHSRVRVETDSNYGSVLSWWDRALGTLRLRDARDLDLGLDGLDGARWQTVVGMLETPFREVGPVPHDAGSSPRPMQD